jgi:hypothetical protein
LRKAVKINRNAFKWPENEDCHGIQVIIYNLPETGEMATGRNYPKIPDSSSRNNVGLTSVLAQSTHLI